MRTNFYTRSGHYNDFQLISLRLIRTPDKENKFWPFVGVRINEVILYNTHGQTLFVLTEVKSIENIVLCEYLLALLRFHCILLY